MNVTFEGRSVLVTGAAHGIGRSIAAGFAERGARVLATDILTDDLGRLAREVAPANGGSIAVATLDVKDDAGVAAIVAAHAGEDGFDVLVHVAGGVLGQTHRPVETVTPDQWDGIYDVNVRGAFLTVQAVVPRMKQRGRGRIVVISSGAGLGISLTGIQAYASAKAAQLGLVRQLGHELGPFGITVNAVAPGFLRSNPDSERQWASYGADGQKAMVDRIPLRRLGLPEDIAHAVLFLSSDYAGWITGQVLRVDGGPT